VGTQRCGTTSLYNKYIDEEKYLILFKNNNYSQKSKIIQLNKLLHTHKLIEKNRDLIKFWGYDKV